MESKKERTDWLAPGMRESCLAQVRADTDTVLLSFSRGKDSLTAWVVLREHGFRVIPYFCEIIPGLQFVEDSVRYYEDFFQTHIYRVLHPALYHWLRTMSFQPPSRYRTLETLALPGFNYADIIRGVRRTAGVDPECWVAIGTRVVDSQMRRMALVRNGPLIYSQRTFSPIYDMRKDELIATLQRAKVKLPVDYRIFGRSFDGIDYRYLKPIHDYFPDDYQRILDWFPWAHLDIVRCDLARKHAQII